MSDFSPINEAGFNQEAVKSSFKSLKNEAGDLLYRRFGREQYDISSFYIKELKKRGISVSQVTELFYFGDNQEVKKALKKDQKGKSEVNLNQIVIENSSIFNSSSYSIFFQEDGSIKIELCDGKQVKEIPLDQFPSINKIDLIKNILKDSNLNVREIIKGATYAGSLLVGSLVGLVAQYPLIKLLNRLEKGSQGMQQKTEYKYDQSLVDKMKKTDLMIQKIKEVYGVNLNYITASYELLTSVVNGQLDSFFQSNPQLNKQEVIDFLSNKRSLITEIRLSNKTEFQMDPESKGNIMDEYSEQETSIFFAKILRSFVKKDKARIKKVLFASNRNGNSDGKGGLMGNNTLATTLGLSNANFLWDEFKNYYHEVSHLVNGMFGNLYEVDYKYENRLHINGYRSDHIADQLVEWVTIFAENPDFFKKYFFDIQGDGTYDLMKQSNALQRSLNEIITISCTNYFFGERGNWMGKDISNYPDIEKAIRRQLAVTTYGGEALSIFPDGLDDKSLGDIRREFGKNYIYGLIDMMGSEELKKEMKRVLSDDLNQYYTKNDQGYLIADGEPKNEMNNRLIEENNLTSFISVRPLDIRSHQYLNQINEFIVRYGSVFFPDGRI